MRARSRFILQNVARGEKGERSNYLVDELTAEIVYSLLIYAFRQRDVDRGEAVVVLKRSDGERHYTRSSQQYTLVTCSIACHLSFRTFTDFLSITIYK